MFFTFDDFSSGRNRIDWQSVFNQGVALGSQAIGAWGKRPTTQIAQGNNGIFAIQASNPSGYGYGYEGNAMAYQQQAALLAAQQRGGVGFDDAATSITSFISRNPLLVGGVVLGAYLLFREPPRRR